MSYSDLTQQEQRLIELIKRLNEKQVEEAIKAMDIIVAVDYEKSAQIVGLRKYGMTMEQIAKMWGVVL